MYDEREKALKLALRTVLSEAKERGLDVDLLCEGAMRSILDGPAREPVLIADAVLAIEVAADALDWAALTSA
ncbi:hypothetical protein [Pseudomonas sp. LS-2]|uniref:hypothetical protein n=1 Tax=Pseudomonas sp. LS-2 TaxID=2315859 RepID=UPI000E715B55|nr:hypothetical protein [Pseudomonas sp. LS-2]RJX81245.1 hypothetical protein D3M70_08845 [Pseudomonas sp. LS-2]